MYQVYHCDKCGQLVPPENDIYELHLAMGRYALVMALEQHRHLLPVIVNGRTVCVGSPSRSQYLENQPRDVRQLGYEQVLQPIFRQAYADLSRSFGRTIIVASTANHPPR